MAFDRDQFADFVDRTLQRLKFHSEAAVQLLLGTAAVESKFGTYLRQLGGGPALGVYQMEPDTEFDIHTNFLRYKPYLLRDIREVCGVDRPDPAALEGNLTYQTAMARMHYLRRTAPLPEAGDIEALARYWKRYYNTPAGKGTEEHFVKAYARYCT